MAEQLEHLKTCDLVMKGGITSGVAYPTVVLALAQRYRFRQIGGTSAGAIAAAVTAAAQYGRNNGTDGFDRLHELATELGRPGFLFRLFQPSQGTGPLLYTLLDFLGNRPPPGANQPAVLQFLLQCGLFLPRLTWSLVRHDTLIAVLTLLGIIAIRVLLPAGPRDLFWMIGTLLLAWVGLLVVGVAHLVILLFAVQANCYGMCSGLRNRAAAPDALTEWLSRQIDRLAGRLAGPPLTFAELARGKEPVLLRMVTTNLSHNQPYVLPFRVNGFIFKEDEWRQLFPAHVVDYLVAHAPTSPILSFERLNSSLGRGRGYHFLPPGDLLPVVVGVRMSLSFPLLISAVPLYTASRAAVEAQQAQRSNRYEAAEADLQRHIFSDGGIASNFPIHFFDVWLPKCPTFGIDLTALPRSAFASRPSEVETRSTETEGGTEAVKSDYLSVLDVPMGTAAEQAEAQGWGSRTRRSRAYTDTAPVYLPHPGDEVFPTWHPINGLPRFLRAILSTTLNYRDATQALLPGYRERIVQIRLDIDEGGLNLDMPPATIARIQDKGQQAGELLRDQFLLEQHKWIRFRSLMTELEVELKQLRDTFRYGYDDAINAKLPVYQQLLQQDTTDNYPFPQNRYWRAEALRRLLELTELLEHWGKADEPFFAQEPPVPEAVLRVTPEV